MMAPQIDTKTRIVTERRCDGGLLHVLLNAPKGNVLDSAMIEEIENTLARQAQDKDLKAVLFVGAGSHFSFGASVEEHAPDKVRAMLTRFHMLFREMAALAVPTLAAVRGQCLGGGMELASWCSVVFAEPKARFGQPEIKLGVFAPVASLVLPWRIGGGRAVELLVSGRTVDAAEAQTLGLVHALAEDPAAAAQAYYETHLAPCSASSLRYAERAARSDLIAHLEKRLASVERLYLDELMATHDAAEGIAAFLDKRPPAWTNT